MMIIMGRPYLLETTRVNDASTQNTLSCHHLYRNPVSNSRSFHTITFFRINFQFVDTSVQLYCPCPDCEPHVTVTNAGTSASATITSRLSIFLQFVYRASIASTSPLLN